MNYVDYWNESAQTYYDLASWHWMVVGYLPVLVELKKRIGSIENLKVLDFGCGAGRTCLLYRRFYHADAAGVDISTEMINKARSADPEGTYLLMDESLRIPTDTFFDCAISHWVLLEMKSLEQMAAELREIYRLLKPGGILISVVNNEDFTGRKSRTWINGEPGRQYKSGEIIVSTIFNEEKELKIEDYYWTGEDYCAAYREAGFAGIESFIPDYQSSEVVREVKYLQERGCFPDVDYSIDREEEAPTRLITGVKGMAR
jgi:SAM-dependent methyltransferase